MDRILTMCTLDMRAKAKIEGYSPAKQRLVSPLKMLKFLASMRRQQAIWLAKVKNILVDSYGSSKEWR
jgi:hypothetical protein